MITLRLKILLCVIFIPVYILTAQSKPYSVQVVSQFPPYSYSENGINRGISLDLIREIADIQKFSVNLSSTERENIYQNLIKGRIDIGAGLLKDTAMAGNLSYSAPYVYSSYDLFSKSQNALNTIAEIKNQIVYVVAGDPVTAQFQKLYPDIEILYLESANEVLTRLAHNKIKYAVLPLESGVIQAGKLGYKDIIFNRLLSITVPVCLAVNKENPELLSKINESISILRSTGKLEDILAGLSSESTTGILWFNSRYFVMFLIVLLNILLIGGVWLINLKAGINKSRKSYNQILDIIPHHIYIKDSKGKFLYANKAFREAYGSSEISLEGKEHSDIHHSERELIKIHEIESSLLDDTSSLTQQTSEEKITFPGGIRKTMQFSRMLLGESDNADKRLLTIAIDITEQVTNIKLLERSETKFKLLFENAGVSIFLHRFNGDIVDINDFALKNLGYTREEMLQMKVWDIEKNFTPFSGSQLLESINPNESHDVEGYHIRKDGTGFRVLVRIAVVKYENEKLVLAITTNIEDQKQREDRIKLQNTALNAAANGIAIIDRKGYFLWVNDAFTKLTGYSKEEIIGNHTRILKSGQHDAAFYKNLWDTVLGGNEWHGNLINKKKSGEIYYEEANITPVYDDFAEITHFVSVKTDITERRQIEQQIRESEQRYRYLFSKAPVGIFQYDKNLILNVFNDHFIGIFRSTREKLQNLDLNNLIDQVFVPNLRSSLKGQDAYYDGPYHTTTSDQNIFISLHTRALFNDKNEITGGIGIVEDITKIKEIEIELIRSEKKYRSIFENLMDVYYMADTEGILLNVSPSIKNLFQVDEYESLLGHLNVKDFYKDSSTRDKLLNELNRYGFVKNFHIELVRMSGEIVHVELNSHFVYDEKGRPVAIEGMIRDITDRKHVEDELRLGEQKLRNIIENSNDGIVLINSEGIIVEWNNAAEKITGYTKNEVSGKFIWDIQYSFAPDDVEKESYRETLKQSVLAVLEEKKTIDETPIQEAKIKRADGKEIFTQSSVAIIKTPQGIMLVSILRDISVLKEAEVQLMLAKERAEKSNKLKSEFLAQMSHEIRTPVNAILSFAGLMEEELHEKLEDDLKEGFRAMRNAGNRIIRTIDLILNMSEIQTGTYDYHRTDIDLYIDILVNLSAEHKTLLKNKHLELNIIKPDFSAIIQGDEYTVNQIFNNLIDNAIKYTPSGHIEVRFENSESEISVFVKDTGIGISPDYLPFLFEAFTQEEQGYTRKFEGNGLGLALVKKYCSLNNAEIRVKSEKGVGTEFCVTFQKTNI